MQIHYSHFVQGGSKILVIAPSEAHSTSLCDTILPLRTNKKRFYHLLQINILYAP